MKDAYPEVGTDYDRLVTYALAEEATFLRTLAAGSENLDASIAAAKDAGTTSIGGAEAFLLHDTYGFPIDLTMEIVEEAGLTVDRDAFDTLMPSSAPVRRPTPARASASSPTRASTATSARRARPSSPATPTSRPSRPSSAPRRRCPAQRAVQGRSSR
jgi:alanyl-tRNA synthetase